ncbi:hypothetical protein GCM10023322_25000 [Rugosimonospora acidiphila]|uniref:Uncharacterized protein n=1 Tax=Rugosimonospora acidiphila TaxID=556531 RepID=A0ABP9RQ22_9ACTN
MVDERVTDAAEAAGALLRLGDLGQRIGVGQIHIELFDQVPEVHVEWRHSVKSDLTLGLRQSRVDDHELCNLGGFPSSHGGKATKI